MAAERRLHTAPPSLSLQIRGLEYEVGAQLMIRSGRGIELSAAGRVFLDSARLPKLPGAPLRPPSHRSRQGAGRIDCDEPARPLEWRRYLRDPRGREERRPGTLRPRSGASREGGAHGRRAGTYR
jgi:hypothetical protein